MSISRQSAEEESSMDYWYPLVKDHLPCPKTESITFSDDILNEFQGACYDCGDPVIIKKYLKKVHKIADRIGYPLFMRSDQGSGKHDWKDTCYVVSRDILEQNLFNLLRWHEIAGIMGLSYKSLYFRELLDIKPMFYAFWGNMPIGFERRLFVCNGKVLCIHPYWEENAIIRSHQYPLPMEWKDIIARSCVIGEEKRQLVEYGETFSQLVPGYWSIDFIKDRQEKWWFIDAAHGEVSWHPEPCEHIIRFEESIL